MTKHAVLLEMGGGYIVLLSRIMLCLPKGKVAFSSYLIRTWLFPLYHFRMLISSTLTSIVKLVYSRHCLILDLEGNRHTKNTALGKAGVPSIDLALSKQKEDVPKELRKGSQHIAV